MSGGEIWDSRYSVAHYAYGTSPNDFLVEVHSKLPKKGKVLCLAEGEGRNAVFLAKQGHDVTAVDFSRVGLEKALRLAKEQGVTIETVHADLAEYALGERQWDAIVSIWAHLPKPLRSVVHGNVVKGLKPGGAFVLEAYTPKQLEYKTGGPPTVELLMTLDALKQELAGLQLVIGREKVREVHEGKLHDGQSAVVQVLAIHP